jgi:hypothetical protein
VEIFGRNVGNTQAEWRLTFAKIFLGSAKTIKE